MDFPISFTEKMKAILGDEYEDFLKGYDRTRHYGLRVNRTKLTAEQFERMCMHDLTPVQEKHDDAEDGIDREYVTRIETSAYQADNKKDDHSPQETTAEIYTFLSRSIHLDEETHAEQEGEDVDEASQHDTPDQPGSCIVPFGQYRFVG